MPNERPARAHGPHGATPARIMPRDEDLIQHLALAAVRAQTAGANVEASIRNAYTDWIRTMKKEAKKSRRTRSLEQLRQEPSVPSFVSDLELSDLAMRLLSMIPPDQARVLAMRYLEDRDYEEIAAALNCGTYHAIALAVDARRAVREAIRTADVAKSCIDQRKVNRARKQVADARQAAADRADKTLRDLQDLKARRVTKS